MAPADLRAITISLNDERGTGGQSRLARLLDWDHSTVWRKLNGKSPITQSDELAIRQALAQLKGVWFGHVELPCALLTSAAAGSHSNSNGWQPLRRRGEVLRPAFARFLFLRKDRQARDLDVILGEFQFARTKTLLISLGGLLVVSPCNVMDYKSGRQDLNLRPHGPEWSARCRRNWLVGNWLCCVEYS
jgi:hypothetical protein